MTRPHDYISTTSRLHLEYISTASRSYLVQVLSYMTRPLRSRRSRRLARRLLTGGGGFSGELDYQVELPLADSNATNATNAATLQAAAGILQLTT